MALYVDEEEVWKCPKHPSRRRRTGICHHCLKERLLKICPDCANDRPCPCAGLTSSSSGSSSSSHSRFGLAAAGEGLGSVGRVSSLIDREPAFRRSRSLAVPFLRFKPSAGDEDCKDSSKKASFWSAFKSSIGGKSKRVDSGAWNDIASKVEDEEEEERRREREREREREAAEERRKTMRKSRSVAVTSESRFGDVRSTKGKGWHFPSPIKAFKQSIIHSRATVHERSPLYRG